MTRTLCLCRLRMVLSCQAAHRRCRCPRMPSRLSLPPRGSHQVRLPVLNHAQSCDLPTAALLSLAVFRGARTAFAVAPEEIRCASSSAMSVESVACEGVHAASWTQVGPATCQAAAGQAPFPASTAPARSATPRSPAPTWKVRQRHWACPCSPLHALRHAKALRSKKLEGQEPSVSASSTSSPLWNPAPLWRTPLVKGA